MDAIEALPIDAAKGLTAREQLLPPWTTVSPIWRLSALDELEHCVGEPAQSIILAPRVEAFPLLFLSQHHMFANSSLSIGYIHSR